MDLTTSARVKAMCTGIPSGDATLDTVIAQVITAVSAAVEDYCDRGFEYVARTEYHNVGKDQMVFSFKGYPAVASSPAIVVSNDTNHETATYTQFPSTTEISRSMYAVDAERGLIIFDGYQPIAGPRSLKVAYTGGFAVGATTAGGFVTACPAVAYAVETQCVHEINRRSTPGINTFTSGSETLGYPVSFSFLPVVEMVLRRYRRIEAT